MQIKLSFICLIFFTSITATSLSFSIGNAKPYGLLPAYSSVGSHYKVNFDKSLDSRSVNDLYLSYSAQYIYFGESLVEESIWNELYGFQPNEQLKISEGERSLMFDAGIKKKWNPNGKNLFLYLGGSAGIAFFKQYTLFDYPDEYDSCDDDNSLFDVDSVLDFLFWLLSDDNNNFTCSPSVDANKKYKTRTKKTSPYLSVNAGINFYVNKSQTIMLGLGISYNMFTNIDVVEYIDINDSTPQILNDLGRLVGADYQTVLFGITAEF